MEEITKIVCQYYGIYYKHVFRESRIRIYVKARQLSMYLIRKSNENISLHNIGDFFDKDHSTVVHSCKTVENDMDTNEKYRKDVEFMLDQIGEEKITVAVQSRFCQKVPFKEFFKTEQLSA